MPVGVGEIADFVDYQQAGAGIVAEPTAQGGVAVEGGKIADVVRFRVDREFAGTDGWRNAWVSGN